MTPRIGPVLLFLAIATQRVEAQRPVTGRVVDSVTAAAIAEVRVRAVGTGSETVTARDGRFTILLNLPADTLLITALGYAPTMVVVAGGDSVVIRLSSAAVVSELTVTAARHGALLGASGRQAIDDSIARVLPLALEPDAFRILAILPSVSFGSILSARPQLLGGSEDDTGFAIDGHSVLNPFHAGRFYAAFPSIAAASTDLELAPGDLALGGTTVGRVNVSGKRWNDDRSTEIQYGLGLWSAMTGWSNDRTALTVAGRTLQGTVAGAAAAVADDEVDIAVGDIYARADIDEFRSTITFFHARDRAGEVDDGFDPDPVTLHLSNTLIGLHSTLGASPRRLVSLRASHAVHRSDGMWIPARSTTVSAFTNLRYRSAELQWQESFGRNGAGVEMVAGLTNRRISNRVHPLDPLEIPPGGTEMTGTALHAGVGLRVPIGRLVLRGGLRADRFNGQTAVQPRLSARTVLGVNGWLELSHGRAASLMHLVSDASTEPKLAFYDYWQVAGQEGIPTAAVTHTALELGRTQERFGYRVRAYRSTGGGTLDIDLDHTPRDQPTLFRVGRTRSVGVEAAGQWRAADHRWRLNASYLLSSSERNWGAGWVPARDDRRHRLRLNGAVDFGFNTVLATTVEAGSALPFTPYATVYPNPQTWGPENSGRGRASVRIDAALTHEFGGPFGSVMTLGASITNLSLGDQVLREPSVKHVSNPDGTLRESLITSEPLFWLPPFPSVLLRVRW